MKRILCFIIFIIAVIAIAYLLIPSQPKIVTEEIVQNPMIKSFRDEIKFWTDMANNETNMLNSTIYRSYAMSNLYFLQPYISPTEYTSISLKIGDIIDLKVPRYIKPEIVLSIV